MPSRPIVLGIFLFWLATIGWMFQRELWPRFSAGEPPPFHIDLADEVGGRVILWEVYQGNERIGLAQSKIKRNADRTFELRNDISFNKLEIQLVQFKRISSVSRITAKSALISCQVTVKLEMQQLHYEIDIFGDVSEDTLRPKLIVRGPLADKLPSFALSPVDVSKKSGLMNVMQPENKIPGLFEGRSWVVPTINPLAASASLLGQGMEMKKKVAIVHTAELHWSGESVACWRIDTGEPGLPPDSQVWVRRSDDLVLQQATSFQGKELVMIRTLTK